MVRDVTATEARARLLALLDGVETGDEIAITRRERLGARIVLSTGGSR
jgi:antitoxin (DNA-binding transcriptional repressor) of toxin-antitoxin stability system